jgi:hypothetical protein
VAVREGYKIAGWVALLALLAANIGLEATRAFAPPLQQHVNQMKQPADAASQAAPLNTPDYENPNVVIGILTLIVLGFQAWVFRRQASIGDKQTSIAERQLALTAGQVDIAEKQFLLTGLQTDFLEKQKEIARQGHLAAHRPMIRVRNIVLRRSQSFSSTDDLFHAGELVSGQLYIVNTGGADAWVTDALVMVYWANALSLPVERPYEGLDGNVGRMGGALYSGRSVPIPFASIRPMQDCGPKILRGLEGWRLHIMGWVEYRDGAFRDGVFLTRRTAFCRLFNPETQRFVRVQDEDYEHEE